MFRFTFVGLSVAAWGLIGIASNAVQASQIAYDTAGDSAYNNGWTQGSDGGFGWGDGWTLATPSPDNTFLGSSNVNSPRAPGGRAWGLRGSKASRAFSGPLTIGQTFSADFETTQVNNPEARDFIELGSGGTFPLAMDTLNTYVFFAYPSSAPLGIPVDSGVPVNSEGIHVTFTRTETAYVAAITPYLPGASTTTVSLPYTGDVDSFAFGRTGVFPDNPLYVNNIQITPEPGSLMLTALGGAGALLRRRRTQ